MPSSGRRANKRNGQEELRSGKVSRRKKDTVPETAPSKTTQIDLALLRGHIHSVNRENQLETLPWSIKRQVRRPWYYFDYVEPAPRFRPVTSEEDNSDDLSDHPSEDRAQVSRDPYIRKYVVRLPWEHQQLDAALFEYSEGDVIDILVVACLWNPLKCVSHPNTWDPEMSFRYKIPAGYHHVLLGFNREIDFIVEDHVDDNESRLRCKYLMQVLDSFVEELKERTIRDPAKFRSKVLNPIIQRQLRGVADNDSDEVKKAVGTKLEDAVNFYLARDPLNPQDCPALFRNLLYITPVRLSFACYDSQCSKAVYEKSRLNTKFLRHSCVQHDTSDQILLLPFEVEVIEHEGLGGLYRGLIKASPRPTGEHTSSVQATPMPIYYVDIVAFDQAAANPSNSLVTLEVYRSEIRSIMLQEQNDAQAILARMNDRRLIWRGLIARWNTLIISQGGQALADSSDDEEPMGV